jgi:integrase/recombinase XerD
MTAQTPVPGLLRSFSGDYLAAQRDVSQNTIYAYRDAIKLFLRFAARHRGRQLLRLQLADLGAGTVLAFLTYLESDRKNSAATRNCRLAASCRLLAYAAGQDPRHAQLCRRVLDIPLKKTTSNSMTYLNQDEVKALLAAPSARHRLGLRDRALLTLPCNTGARATEVVQLNIKDLRLETPSQVRILGKGRKERTCPLWQETSDALRGYLRQRADGTQPDAPLFLNAHGERITRFGVGTTLQTQRNGGGHHSAVSRR